MCVCGFFSLTNAGIIKHSIQKVNLDLNLTLYTKVNSKWIIGLKTKCRIIWKFKKKTKNKRE